MKSLRARASFASIVAFALLAFASRGAAQPGTEAEYRTARQLLESEQPEQAVVRYREIAERADEARAWLGLAVATNLAGDPTTAATYVERALSRTTDPWLARNMAAVEGYARQFWPLVGRLVLTCEVAGAEVFVDGQRIGTTPLPAAGVVVASGERRVEFRSSTHEDQTITLRVAASDYDITPEIQVTRRIVTLNPRPVRMVGHLLVETNIEGAAVFVDETYRATAPLTEPLEVEPGSRRVAVRATGYEEAYQVVEIAGTPANEPAAPVSVTIELSQRTVTASRGGVSNAVRYSILGAGGLIVAGAGVTSGLWASAHTDLDRYCSNGVCVDNADSRDARDRFRVMRLTSIVGGGVGAAMIVTALVLPRGSREAAVTADVDCSGDGCSARVFGRF